MMWSQEAVAHCFISPSGAMKQEEKKRKRSLKRVLGVHLEVLIVNLLTNLEIEINV